MTRHELSLRPGYHGPEAELQFVDKIVKLIRSTGYADSIQLIGSRALGKWISTVNFDTYCRSLPTADYQLWYSLLNRMAIQQNLIAKNIPKLAKQLPPDVPPEIIEFLEPSSDPASDFDLRIDHDVTGIDAVYIDRKTRQNVDIKSPRTLSY